jgi:hypothetical protein
MFAFGEPSAPSQETQEVAFMDMEMPQNDIDMSFIGENANNFMEGFDLGEFTQNNETTGNIAGFNPFALAQNLIAEEG